jgi:Flp pilus assembly protein TadG
MMRCQLDRKGQEVVEYALVLPILLLLVFGIIDFGVTVFVYNSIANAAREGARTGVVIPFDENDDTAAEQTVSNAVVNRTGWLNLDADEDITVTRTVTRTQVEVVYEHRLLTGPIIQVVAGGPEIQLRSVATMHNE